MESITIDGKRLVKASSVAREFGYTTDYIGQLCRGGKVEAQLVGRSWFVDPTTLKSHKQTRYRSTLQKTKLAVAEAKPRLASVRTVPATEKFSEQFYKRAVNPSITIRYEHDAEDLLPVVSPEKKAGEVAVRLAEAKAIAVEPVGEKYHIVPTPKPKIRFKGSVRVESAEDIHSEVSEENLATVPESDSAASKQTAAVPTTPVAASEKTTAASKTMVTNEKTRRPVRLSDLEPTPRAVHIEVTSVTESSRGVGTWLGLSLGTLLLVAVLGGAVITLETRLAFSSVATTDTLSFDPTNLQEVAFKWLKI